MKFGQNQKLEFKESFVLYHQYHSYLWQCNASRLQLGIWDKYYFTFRHYILNLWQKIPKFKINQIIICILSKDPKPKPKTFITERAKQTAHKFKRDWKPLLGTNALAYFYQCRWCKTEGLLYRPSVTFVFSKHVL